MNYSRAEAADRAGVGFDDVNRLVDLGIAEYARPGEVLVSRQVVDASAGADASFTEFGLVELKGVGGEMQLHAAHRPG
ncbi:MAG: hypothetical protein ABI458_06855 [Chloroflexota bacterium]